MSNIEMNAIYFDTKILIAFYHWNTIQVKGSIHMKRPIYLIWNLSLKENRTSDARFYGYHMRAIITRGLYIFYPIFQGGL